MNIRLYHPDSIVENTTSLLTKEHTHYIVNVMRLKRGSNLNFFNKEGEWKGEIIFLEKDRVEVKFIEKIKTSSNSSKIEIAISLIKKNMNNLETYNFKEIINKYNINDHIIMIVFKDNNKVRVYNKIFFNQKNTLKNINPSIEIISVIILMR